jgi:hypothetical protein
MELDEQGWARETFGAAKLGDERRTRRLVKMAAQAARAPGGRVLEVYGSSAERQGAYDLLANDAAHPSAITEALGESTARSAADLPMVFVSVDGSSLSLTDTTGEKGFGGVGSTRSGGRGLKVISALALDEHGTLVGVLDQQWWARPRRRKRNNSHSRKLEDKETKHWVTAIQASAQRLRQHAPDTRPCFLLDRESDGRHCLEALRESGAFFVVRSAFNRRLHDDLPRYLVGELEVVSPILSYALDVKAGPRRTARRAHMSVRVLRTKLRLRDRITDRAVPFDVWVVEAREEGTCPSREKPISWRLLTNCPVATAAQALWVIDAYAKRWSIEVFHKTWKSGACNVEQCQLRKASHVIKWGTLMAAVAVRIERVKTLSRSEPDLPADREFSKHELLALITLKRTVKRRNEEVPDTVPTLAQAIWWMAELGGYTGKSSGGPPGSITIRRGYEKVAAAAKAIRELERLGKLR